VYEVAPHPDFNFKAGDTVLRLAAPGSLDPTPPLASRVAAQIAAEHDAAMEAERAAAAAAAAPAAADEPAPAGGGRSAFHETMQTFLGGLAAPLRSELATDESDDDGDGDGGVVKDANHRLGLSAWVGEILTVGPMLTVRWMDGTVGTAPPEELYVVNTDEEARPAQAPCTCSPWHRTAPGNVQPRARTAPCFWAPSLKHQR